MKRQVQNRESSLLEQRKNFLKEIIRVKEQARQKNNTGESFEQFAYDLPLMSEGLPEFEEEDEDMKSATEKWITRLTQKHKKQLADEKLRATEQIRVCIHSRDTYYKSHTLYN